MTEVKIELDQNGIHEFLRHDPDITADLLRRCQAIKDAAGDGMESRVYIGKDRVRGEVWTGNAVAMLAEAEDRALTRSLDAGRT